MSSVQQPPPQPTTTANTVFIRGLRVPHEDPGSRYAYMQQEVLRPPPWQNPETDKPFRQSMIGRIHHLLRMRKPDAEQDWLKRLPDMAKRLEDSLYRSAASLNEYDEESTLKVRLQQIAQDLKNVPAGGNASQRNMTIPSVTPLLIPAEYPPRPAPPPPPAPQQSVPSVVQPPVARTAPPPSNISPTPLPSQPPQQNGGNNNFNTGTPFGGNVPVAAPVSSVNNPPTPFSGHGTPYTGGNPADYFGDGGGTPAPPVPGNGQMTSPPASINANGGRPTQSDVLRQQQQRLLLLRHASKCPTVPGEVCPATIHCQSMKILWKHIAVCKDPQCPTPHCVSSRFVLSHYHKCMDASCGVCEPVRLAIRKNSENKPAATGAGANPAQPPPHHPQQPTPQTPAATMGNYGTPAPTTGAAGGGSSDLIPRYITLWKQISANAAAAREKSAQLEKAREEAIEREKDLQLAQEENAAHNMHEIKDDVWESHSEMLKRKIYGLQQAASAAKSLCMQIESDVNKMRQAHDRNVEAERRLQVEFTTMFPGEQGKNAIMQARNDAQQQQLQRNHSQSMMSMQRQPSMSSSSAPKPLPIGQISAQTVINQQMIKQKGKGSTAAAAASKEPKEAKPKKARKSAAAGASSSTQPSPGPMAVAYRPPPSPKSGPPNKKLMSAAPVEPAKKIEHIVPMFRPCPSYSPMIFETSLINTLNRIDIQSHVQFLSECLKESEMQSKTTKFREVCLMFLKKCQEADTERIFAQPVDPIQDSAPNYLQIIKKPMDFSTIRENVDRNVYTPDLKLFLNDMRLVYANCLQYNPSTSIYYTMGLRGGQLLEREIARYYEHEEEKLAQQKYNVNNCSLCFGNKLLYEQQFYFCSGPCGKKIPKSSQFYTAPDGRHFCNVCLSDMDDPIQLNDGLSINKRELKKDKHPEPQEEGFVSCYSCKRWMHQICAMLNTKRGQDAAKDDFLCPSCVLQVTDYHPKLADNFRKKCTARDLPETEFSRYVESRLLAKMEKLRAEHVTKDASATLAQEFEDAKSLTVRIVMAREAEVWARDGMKKMYPDFPPVFHSTQRALLLFQKLDGIDVLLFVMFLQEYGSDCPAPNNRCVYLAYLDSVNYLRPAVCRTSVYHELIINTMAYERSCGYTRFFIWACPPVGGDDYIFHVHPKNQKTPKPERLRLWYYTLLEAARQQGVVVSLSNFFDEYFARMSELKTVPYFEGDCWTGYAEHYLTELEQRGGDFKAMAAKTDIINKAVARKQSGDKMYAQSMSDMGRRQGSITTKRGRKKSHLDASEPEECPSPVDDTHLSHALMCPPPRPLESVPMQSALTWRIANEIERMRDDFIVVKMIYDCVQCAAPQDFPGAVYWLPKQYSPELDPHDYKKKRYAPPYCLCHECYQDAYQQEFGKPLGDVKFPQFPPPEWEEEYRTYLEEKAKEEKEQQPPPPPQQQRTPATEGEEEDVVMEDAADKKTGGQQQPASPASKSTTAKRSSSRKRKAAADDSDVNGDERDSCAERGIEVLEFGVNAKPPNPYGPLPPCSLTEFRVEVAMIRPKTRDVDAMIECPIFHAREDFLDLCKGNKYQYDDLRRAKHSSAMVLFHLHNPDSESFVRSCNGCQVDIQGVRYTCNTPPCQDFDLCPKCHETVKHQHPLQMVNPMAVTVVQSQSSTNSPSDGIAGGINSNSANSASNATAVAQLTQAATAVAPALSVQDAQKEQTRIVTQEILSIFPHASTCTSQACQVTYCDKAKRLFEHLSTCEVQVKGGCTSCKRGWYLMTYHSRICRLPAGQCKVKFCELLKERTRVHANKNSDRRVMALMQRQTQQHQQGGDEAVTPDSSQQSQTPGVATTITPGAMAPISTSSPSASSPPAASIAPAPVSRQGSQVFGGKGKRPQNSEQQQPQT